MRIPYGFDLTSLGSLEIKETEAETVRMIFDYYLAGASLGKVVDMLFKNQILSPTRKAKWTRAAVDHLLSNSKYIAIIGFESFTDVQFEKSARSNVDYDKAGLPRRSTRYVSPSMLQTLFLLPISHISVTIASKGEACGREKTRSCGYSWNR